MWKNRENKQIKYPHVKYEMSNRLASLEVGAYCTASHCHDGIMIILVIVPMLTNYLGMPLIYLTAAPFFPESEGVYVNSNLRIL